MTKSMATSTVLDRIAHDVRARLETRKSRRDSVVFRDSALLARAPHDFRKALLGPQAHIIAEVKLRSPSEGEIATSLDPIRVAEEYVEAGATAISVLTEEDHFGGKLSSLGAIRARLPEARLLMKDFVIDEEQIFEARIHGADAVLLIVALLGEERTGAFLRLARELGLSALVEVHNEQEMESAANVGADLIGVNNRDLKTLQVSLEVSHRLATLAPKGAILVAESGLKNAAAVAELKACGYSAFLIGTSFMKTGTPGLALARLKRELA